MACPTAEKSCRCATLSIRRTGMPFSSPRPLATAPDEIKMTSTPARRNSATWSTRADIRVMSNAPSLRVSTLLPIFTAMRLYTCDMGLPV